MSDYEVRLYSEIPPCAKWIVFELEVVQPILRIDKGSECFNTYDQDFTLTHQPLHVYRKHLYLGKRVSDFVIRS